MCRGIHSETLAMTKLLIELQQDKVIDSSIAQVHEKVTARTAERSFVVSN